MRVESAVEDVCDVRQLPQPLFHTLLLHETGNLGLGQGMASGVGWGRASGHLRQPGSGGCALVTSLL